MLPGELSHLLVHRDRVAVRGAELASGQPDFDAVVVVAEGSGVVHPADRRDDLAVLLQRLERPGKLVIPARREDLIVQRMHAVRKVDESAAPRRRGGFFHCPERDHAIEHGQGDASAHCAKRVAAGDPPELR